jgi:hypothetical protein
MLAISYKGDLQGWRAKLEAYCKESGRIWGTASGQQLFLADGKVLRLEECKVVFEG